MADELKHAVKITCEADPRNWLEFSRDISQRQRRAYVNATLPDEKIVTAEKELPEAEREAAEKAREEAAQACLRQTVTDGEIVFEGGEVLRGIDAILAADPDTMTVIGVSFLATAPFRAFQELASLGNLKRLG